VYDGALHFVLSPDYVAPVVGLALVAGLRGPDHGRWTLFTVVGAWLIGALIGAAPPPGLISSLSIAGACLLLGILAAADLRMPLVLTVVLAAVVGFFEGAMNATAMGISTSTNLLPAFGALSTAFLLTAFGASLIVPLRILWLRIAARVAGSWLAALGLLLVGWAIHVN
jgi:hydrogenase/urease accessory protein HupE